MASEVPELIERLQSGDVAIRRAAAESLARVAAGASADAAPIVAACRDTDEQVREWIFATLEELPAPPADCVKSLSALLRDQNTDVAYWAATLLGRMQTEAAPSVPNLAAILAAHPQMAVRQRAAWALSKIGPAAVSARQQLAEAATSDDRRLAMFAKLALKAITG